jgi:hypothetical protein
MTPFEKDEVLRNLPSVRDDSAWVTLLIERKRTQFENFILRAAQLYHLDRVVVITVKRTRVEKRFYEAFRSLPWELLEPVMAKPTKDNLYPLVMFARLNNQPLPAPVDYFAP